MSTNNQATSGGIGVVGLLGVAFVVLKLMGVINWSWWWVTLPFWGGLALGIGILIMLLVFVGIAALVGAAMDSRRKSGSQWRR